MIPTLDTDLSKIEFVEMPSINYKMDMANRIYGMTDKLEAMKQVAYKRLLTERYQYIIYSWNYGIELIDLFGQPMSYVIPEVQRRIEDNLLADGRFVSLTDFKFDTSKRNELLVTFTANTIYGDISLSKGVKY